MHWLIEALREHPELALFLTLALGHGVGKLRVAGITRSGLPLILAAIIVTTVPHVVTLLVGRHIVKLHPGILIGVCSGAGTSAPALAAVQELADSRIPAPRLRRRLCARQRAAGAMGWRDRAAGVGLRVTASRQCARASASCLRKFLVTKPRARVPSGRVMAGLLRMDWVAEAPAH